MRESLPLRCYASDEPPFPRLDRLYYADPHGQGLPKWQWWLRTQLRYLLLPLTGRLEALA